MSNIRIRRQAAKRARAAEFGKLEVAEIDEVKARLKKLDFKLKEKIHSGACTAIYKVAGLSELYGRKNLCLKVFTQSRSIWGGMSNEGRSPIIESTKVQNLMAVRGLASRVYDLVEVEGKTAQVCDYLEGETKPVPIKDSRFTFNEGELEKGYNFIDGKLIDFQAARFVNYEDLRAKLLNKAHNFTQWPWGGGGLYQSTPYLSGKRNTHDRLKRLGFKDFEGKTILDVGCNIGMFCREASKLGAKRVVGLDTPLITDIARELAILDGYFNIDFFGVELKKFDRLSLIKLTGISRFNIVLYLAMEDYLGWPAWVKNCDTLYYEGHGVERRVRVLHYKG